MKRVTEVAKLAYDNKKKALSLPRNLTHVTFCQLLKVILAKINLLYFSYLMVMVCFSASDKTKLFGENFSKDFDLDESDISLSAFSP